MSADSMVRSLLFVPASRPDRFGKALAAGADGVIIDLEDAVQADAKMSARAAVADFLQANPGSSVMVRINGAATPWFNDDIAMCAKLDGVQAIVLPKTESPGQIDRVAQTGKPVLPIIESTRGVLALPQLAACRGVMRFSFGYLDLMLQTGTTPDTAGARVLLDHIRCQLLLHSAANQLMPPLDGVYADFANEDGLRSLTIQVRDMGFGGLLCIHPKQVAVVNQVYAPSPAQLDWARRVVAVADDTGSMAFQVDGKMVDAPVIERARRLLIQAG